MANETMGRQTGRCEQKVPPDQKSHRAFDLLSFEKEKHRAEMPQSGSRSMRPRRRSHESSKWPLEDVDRVEAEQKLVVFRAVVIWSDCLIPVEPIGAGFQDAA